VNLRIFCLWYIYLRQTIAVAPKFPPLAVRLLPLFLTDEVQQALILEADVMLNVPDWDANHPS
jgi:hypothetical protein